jgi:hypothetical protein
MGHAVEYNKSIATRRLALGFTSVNHEGIAR